MSNRNRSPKSDILSGAGALFEGYRILKDQHGVADDDWRRMLKDPVVAGRVAAGFSGKTDFDLRVESAHLAYVDSRVGETDRWTDAGDRVRGGLVLVDMRDDYLEGAVRKAVAQASDKLGKKLELASIFEGVTFARWGNDSGWNRTDRIAIFGSRYHDQFGDRIAVLSPELGGRLELRRYDDDSIWLARVLVLCVALPQ